MTRLPLMAGLLLALVVWGPASWTLGGAASAAGLPPEEEVLIRALIDAVGRMTDAHFIRNGRSYDARTAAEFLQRKWRLRAAEVGSAAEFIDQVGSHSATTGRSYLVRFADGREIPCAVLLRTELDRRRRDGR